MQICNHIFNDFQKYDFDVIWSAIITILTKLITFLVIMIKKSPMRFWLIYNSKRFQRTNLEKFFFSMK